tara:strand:+ start:46 stop:201 length:156 start_codon:yes stop_codon:yes gene_type:complete
MIYLVAVKLKDDKEVQIYEFKSMEDRLIFVEQLRHYDNVEDISYSQIEKED